MSRLSAAGPRHTLARMEPPQWILAALGAVLVVVGLVELLADGWVWVYLIHLLAGAAALAVAPRKRLVKPAVVLLGVVFVLLYVVESANPEVVGDAPDPSSNASLILTGFVLVGIMAALLWPWQPPEHRDGRGGTAR
ncbi:hypothetical protein [Pseudonocardia nigra]|uniref:hypothetical protein n=1 Tax=Pseudonocardia nigra TaxID=1921578 RepID=UPI001C5D4A46|nr:hypothetical protein [Pseudonocardia nigra]